MPLYVFCGDQLLVSYLRPSHRDGALHAGVILKLLVKRFRQVWPQVNITFRGDCAFSRKRILYWCENNQVDYVVGLSQNNRLLKMTDSFLEKVKGFFLETDKKQRHFTELTYQAESWNRSRRVIVKGEYNEKGSNLRFILTNKKEEAQEIYDQQYCLRGDMENYIKQQKLDLSAQRVSCHAFMANQFRILLSGFAYVILSALRHDGLSATELEKSYCQTIRNKILKIGAVVIKNTRHIRFLFSSHYPQQALFQKIVLRLVPT